MRNAWRGVNRAEDDRAPIVEDRKRAGMRRRPQTQCSQAAAHGLGIKARDKSKHITIMIAGFCRELKEAAHGAQALAQISAIAIVQPPHLNRDGMSLLSFMRPAHQQA